MLDERKSYPEEANLSTIRHPRLNSHPHFIEMKKTLHKFYKDRRENQLMHPGRSLKWKEHFYSSLNSLMKEMTFTSCPLMQTRLLERVYAWFSEKVREKVELPPIKVKKKKTLPVVCEDVPTKRISIAEPVLPKLIEQTDKETVIEKAGNSIVKADFIYLVTHNKSNSLGKTLERCESPPIIYSVNKKYTKTSDREPVSIVDFRKSETPNPALKYTGIDKKDQFKRKIFREKYRELSPEKKIQFDEILRAKKKLAERAVMCPVKVLEKGLLMPDIPFDDMLTPAHFPQGGENLMKMPVREQKKKKKRGKIKKKAKK